jgi:hypothetical protein
MSDSSKDSQDVFSVCEKNINKFFSEIAKSTPKYQNSISTLQKDYLDAWKHVLNSAIALEREYATKAGLKADIPDATLQAVRTITQQTLQAYETQNKILQNSGEITKQAFNVFNQNSKSFASLNRDIMGIMMSAFQQRSKI